jgi:hypothetical protein
MQYIADMHYTTWLHIACTATVVIWNKFALCYCVIGTTLIKTYGVSTNITYWYSTKQYMQSWATSSH